MCYRDGQIKRQVRKEVSVLRYHQHLSLQISHNKGNLTYVSSISSLIKNNYLQAQRVLLTIGSQNLHLFKNYHNQATLFTRILPYPKSLSQAIEAGFTSDRIIAIRPPFIPQFEKSLCQLWNIETIVTKASGIEGGENIKQKLARELNLKLMIIQRPELEYPRKTDNFNSILTFCLKNINHNY